jgi:hypothetical protein
MLQFYRSFAGREGFREGFLDERESIAPQLAEVKVLSATAIGISNTKRLVSSSGFKPFRCGKERVYSNGGG